jgi:hypothetical protein
LYCIVLYCIVLYCIVYVCLVCVDKYFLVRHDHKTPAFNTSHKALTRKVDQYLRALTEH